MYTFLLIDDSRVMRRMLQNTLKTVGYENCRFLEAVDGQDALVQLEKEKYEVDLIFCDLCMPNLDGIGFIDTLAGKGLLKQLPIIVLTGDVRDNRCAEVLEKGARKLVSKPFSKENLVTTIDAVLKRNKVSGT